MLGSFRPAKLDSLREDTKAVPREAEVLRARCIHSRPLRGGRGLLAASARDFRDALLVAPDPDEDGADEGVLGDKEGEEAKDDDREDDAPERLAVETLPPLLLLPALPLTVMNRSRWLASAELPCSRAATRSSLWHSASSSKCSMVSALSVGQ